MVSYTPSSEDVRLYEVAILYPYPVHQKEEAELLKNIEGLFEEAGAKQIFKDVWGRRGLAYRIGGFEEGTFVIYYYEMDPAKLKEIDRQMHIMKGLLRHLVVKPPKHYHITSHADNEKKWKEKYRLESERQEAEREEQLKKKVVDKARRQSVRKKPEEEARPAKPASGESIDVRLDKLISDTDIDL